MGSPYGNGKKITARSFGKLCGFIGVGERILALGVVQIVFFSSDTAKLCFDRNVSGVADFNDRTGQRDIFFKRQLAPVNHY